MRKFLVYVGGAIIFSVFVAGFIAYFITSFNAETHTWFDGFGRPLSESPLLMRFMFGQDRLWTGWGWFLADMVIFWGGVAVGFGLVSYGSKDAKVQDDAS
ncbi:MAG: hypothetical protein Q7N50_13610 [Armatimonadota bacterium]|nr:hypothetical protein [Armatimonadota bacterium]